MLTVAVSSRALFNLEDAHRIYQKQGVTAFTTYMQRKEHVPLREGVAFGVVKKILALNMPDRDPVARVVLLSRNSPAAGLRIMNSAAHYGLNISQGAFSQGTDRFRYATALKVDLFLSAEPDDVAAAIEAGVAAAVLMPGDYIENDTGLELRIALDGDSVVFSGEADAVYHEHGLEAFVKSELAQAKKPLQAGPFKNVLHKLSLIQKMEEGKHLRTALVTARGGSVHERVLRTLRSWGISVDEAVFAGGLPKGPLLKAFGADIFFDDAHKNIASAIAHDIVGGYVPVGVGSGIERQSAAA